MGATIGIVVKAFTCKREWYLMVGGDLRYDWTLVENIEGLFFTEVAALGEQGNGLEEHGREEFI